jgi:hypothetical protein
MGASRKTSTMVLLYRDEELTTRDLLKNALVGASCRFPREHLLTMRIDRRRIINMKIASKGVDSVSHDEGIATVAGDTTTEERNG